MAKLRWQFVLVALALLAIAILLLAQQPLLSAFTAEPAQGGVYIEGLVGSLSRLNPLFDDANPADQDIDRLLFSGLIYFDDRGNPQPDLAEVWGISLDGLQYNFALRAGLTWHDGEPLTAADVAFTANLLKDPNLPIPEDVRTLWSQVEVTAFDDTHIQFRLPSPYAPFMDALSFGVLPQHVLGSLDAGALRDAPFNLNPVGSGPYRFGELISEGDQVTGVTLSAWDDYHLGRPFIDQIVFHYYATSADAYQAYQLGDVLGISFVDRQTLPSVMGDTTLSLYSARLPRLSMVLLNLDNAEVPFFKELEVRQALLQGINRQWLIDQYLGGQGFIANSPILPGSWAFNPSVAVTNFDTDKAITTLKAAGYVIPAEGGQVRSKDGIALEFTLAHPDDALHTQLAESIRTDLAKLGVQVTLLPVAYETLITDYLETRAYEAALVDLNMATSPDPDPYPFWHQAEITGGQNYSKWDDRRASEYLEQARVSISQNQRARLYRNFQTHFARELPALPLYYPVYDYAVSNLVQGVAMGPIYQSSDRFLTVREWFLVSRSAAEQQAATAAPVIVTPSPSPQP